MSDHTRVGHAAGSAPAPGLGSVPTEGTANERQNYRSPHHADPEYPAHFPDLSAKHADAALGALVQSRRTDLDSRERERLAAESKVLANLSLRDKLDQLEATISRSADALLASQAKLNADVQMASQTLHADARDLRARLRVIEGENAA